MTLKVFIPSKFFHLWTPCLSIFTLQGFKNVRCNVWSNLKALWITVLNSWSQAWQSRLHSLWPLNATHTHTMNKHTLKCFSASLSVPVICLVNFRFHVGLIKTKLALKILQIWQHEPLWSKVEMEQLKEISCKNKIKSSWKGLEPIKSH